MGRATYTVTNLLTNQILLDKFGFDDNTLSKTSPLFPDTILSSDHVNLLLKIDCTGTYNGGYEMATTSYIRYKNTRTRYMPKKYYHSM